MWSGLMEMTQENHEWLFVTKKNMCCKIQHSRTSGIEWSCVLQHFLSGPEGSQAVWWKVRCLTLARMLTPSGGVRLVGTNKQAAPWIAPKLVGPCARSAQDLKKFCDGLASCQQRSCACPPLNFRGALIWSRQALVAESAYALSRVGMKRCCA